MKKSELKQLIKPLVKECIQEALIEEGLLSNVVSEVVKGMQTAPLVENRQQERPTPTRTNIDEAQQMRKSREKMNARRQELMEAVGKDAYNGVDLFEGTNPMTAQESSAPKAGNVDLGNSSDSGVDISSLVGGASRMWDAMK
jgi:hypothetical protein